MTLIFHGRENTPLLKKCNAVVIYICESIVNYGTYPHFFKTLKLAYLVSENQAPHSNEAI
jgi:hypothetical protein